MINDLSTPDSEIWKFVDDTTVDEIIDKNGVSTIQNTINDLTTQISAEKFQLNESKCKELRIGFSKPSAYFDQITVNGIPLEIVSSAKILELNVSSNLKWNEHIYEVITKARKRLYFLTQLKRAKVATNELVLFYCTCIRPILEYASPVFHNGLTKYLSNDLKMVQKRAMRITFPWTSYTDALPLAGLQQLDVRRDELTKKLFQEIIADESHTLHGLLPPRNNTCNINLSSKRKFNVTFRTGRFKNSFIIHNALTS